MARNKKTQRHLSRTYQPRQSKNNHTHDNGKHKYSHDYTFLMNSHQPSKTEFAIISLLLLSACVTPALAQCNPPKGSYLDTCKVTGSTYYSTDPNLKSVAMCKFDLKCETLKQDTKSTTFYVQESMKGCLKFFENCDGQPVVREGNERFCKDPDVAKSESIRHLEL